MRATCAGSPRDLCRKPTKPVGNWVRAWWSDDLVTWHTTAKPAIQMPSYPFNTGVTPVAIRRPQGPGAGAGVANSSLNFVMVSEHGRVYAHASPDRNLTRGWQMVAPGGTGFGACPAVHFAEEDEYFYVISVRGLLRADL